jgi:putative ABC transport system ATP-binding protein
MRSQGRRSGNKFKGNDLTRLIALPLAYIEARHRLGLLDEALEARLLKARRPVRERLEKSADPGVEFYDADKVCAAAPLKDNLLFGRVSHSAANAQARITESITGVVDEMSLRPGIEREGLSHQVGPAGRMLSAQQRASINLVRCLVKRPDILSIDGALAPFGETQRRDLTGLLLELSEDRTIFVVLPNDRETEGFDGLIRFCDGKAEFEDRRDGTDHSGGDQRNEKSVRSAGTRLAGGVT